MHVKLEMREHTHLLASYINRKRAESEVFFIWMATGKHNIVLLNLKLGLLIRTRTRPGDCVWFLPTGIVLPSEEYAFS